MLNITNIIYIICCVIAMSSVFVQAKYSLYFNVFLKKINESKKQRIEEQIINLISANAILKQENNNLHKYNILYNKVLSKIDHHTKAIVEINYIINTINGKYVISEPNNKVEKNNLALDENFILIGRVVESNKNLIKILLLSDEQSNIPVYIGKSNGIIHGTNDESCKISFQNLSNFEPNDGDPVVTSGINDLTIRGIVAGSIKKKSNKWCVDNENINFLDKIIIVG